MACGVIVTVVPSEIAEVVSRGNLIYSLCAAGEATCTGQLEGHPVAARHALIKQQLILLTGLACVAASN